MASYGSIYEFVHDSVNGSEIRILVRKKSQDGGVPIRRPLGRAPILKRENNDRIFGTSLELYAECKVDGEYSQFYTSSADEFQVEVWRSTELIWKGFVTPELYSEPDVAPPYDVQIIATDGLGELKNFTFSTKGPRTVYEHLKGMLDHVELARSYGLVSDLRYSDGDSLSNPVDIFNIRVDLEHEIGENCYDVLQRLLASINAGMTLFGDKWLIFRETDFIRMAGEEWVSGVYHNGLEAIYRIEDFGSMAQADWWPIGQMSAVIEPAQKALTLKSPNSYKANALASSWTMGNAATYNDSEGAYILPDEGSYMMQSLDFGDNEVGYRLALRVSARNVGQGDEDQAVGIRVKINSHTASGYREDWLVRVESSDRGTGGYAWRTQEDWIEGELAVPMDSDASSDAQDVDIIIPLYDNRLLGIDTRIWIYARSIEVTVFNPSGIHDIYVYGVFLTQYEQTEGYQANVSIDNGARESGNEVTFSLTDGSRALPSAYQFMTGLPLLPASDTEIQSWSIGGRTATDYLSAMGEDYAMKVALPRMSYKGKLNVPVRPLPLLFRREGTLYFPRTYSWDLYNDELEVDLISVPAADITSSSVVVSQIAQPQGSFSSSGSGGGGGIGGVDLSGYAKKEEVTTLADLLASMWTLDQDGNLVANKQVIIKNNLIVTGDTASGGEGEDTPAIGTVTGVSVNGVEYTDVTAGILDLSDAFNSVSIDLSDYYTKVQVDNKIAGLNVGQYATVTALNAVSDRVLTLENAGYATTGYVDTKIANLINGAPTTLDTLKEIADALAENEDVVDALEAAIGTKANASDLTALAARVTTNEGIIASLSSGKADKATTLAGYGITNAYTKTEVDSKVTTINTSITAVSNRVTTLESWKTDIAKYITIVDGNVKISTNLIVSGDTASGGDGEDTAAIGTVTGIKVNGTTYNPTAGIVTIPDYPTSLEWNAISGKPTFATVATSGSYDDLSNKPTIPSVPTNVSYFTNDAGYINAQSTITYALQWKNTESLNKADANRIDNVNGWMNKSTGSTNMAKAAGTIMQFGSSISKVQMFAGYAGNSSTGGDKGFHLRKYYADYGWDAWEEIITSRNIVNQSVAYATSAGSAPASDVYAWAKASTKPAYTTKEVTESGNLYFTNARAVAALTDTLASYAMQSWVEGKKYITASAIPTLYVLTIKKADGTTLVAFDPEEEDKTITLGKADVGLGNVENTALSTWAGSSKITTLGTITSGTWNGSKIANSYLANSAMTIAGNSVSLGGSLAVATLQSSLGLGSLAYKSSLVASDIPNLDWSKITSGKPTTVAGYGITDAITTGNIGSQSVKYATSAGYTPYLKHSGGYNPAGMDANTYTNGGIVTNYGSSGVWQNTPSGMLYGCILNLRTPTYTELQGQLAWDINHASTTDTTRYLWWRASDDGTFTEAKWHQIAFTDSNVASATKLATARTIWGQSFDGTGNVSGNMVVNNDSALYFYDTKSAFINAVYLESTNKFYLGLGVGRAGYNTYLDGYNISLRYGTSQATGLTLNSSGNVTIGASDLAGTSAKLYVNGNTTINGVLDVNNSVEINNGSLTIVKGQIIRFHNTTDNTFIEALGFRGDSFHIGYGNRSLYDTYVQGNNIVFRPGAGTEAMRLDSSGNVGIGTTSPAYKLDVAGTGRFTSTLTVGGATTIGGALTVNASATINGNLVVTGDVASA